MPHSHYLILYLLYFTRLYSDFPPKIHIKQLVLWFIMFTPLACCWSYSTSRDINSLPFCQLQIFSWFSVINENNTSLLGFLRDLSLCFPTRFFLIWRPYMDKVLEITVITQFLFVYCIMVGFYSLFSIIWLLFTVQFTSHNMLILF